MFDHILTREREVFWQYGEVTCAAFSLKDLDTVRRFFPIAGYMCLCGKCGSLMQLVYRSLDQMGSGSVTSDVKMVHLRDVAQCPLLLSLFFSGFTWKLTLTLYFAILTSVPLSPHLLLFLCESWAWVLAMPFFVFLSSRIINCELWVNVKAEPWLLCLCIYFIDHIGAGTCKLLMIHTYL